MHMLVLLLLLFDQTQYHVYQIQKLIGRTATLNLLHLILLSIYHTEISKHLASESGRTIVYCFFWDIQNIQNKNTYTYLVSTLFILVIISVHFQRFYSLGTICGKQRDQLDFKKPEKSINYIKVKKYSQDLYFYICVTGLSKTKLLWYQRHGQFSYILLFQIYCTKF